jgi:glycosyltransferase involved in cell wall biosynthesis
MTPPAAATLADAPAAVVPHDPRLRVLLLTDEMEIGGTQRQIVHIATSLDRRRFDVTVLYFRNRSSFCDDLAAKGVKVVCVPKRGAVDLRFVRNLRRELQRGRYDVMHCFAFSGELWGAVARWLLPAAHQPALLSSVRGVYEWYKPWQWRAKRWVTHQSFKVISNSRMGAAYAGHRMQVPDQAFAVVYNGVATPPPPGPELSRALRDLFLGGAEGPLLLFVGRLVEHKDIPTLLRAMAQARPYLPGLRLAIVGDGPLRRQIQAEIDDEQLSGVAVLLGERGDVSALIDAADALVSSSVREGLSNVVLEAMVGGRPVIASNAGGNVELVEHERTGLLFPVGDDTALASAIRLLASDTALRSYLGDQGRLRAERQFSVPAMVHAYETLYAAAGVARLSPA